MSLKSSFYLLTFICVTSITSAQNIPLGWANVNGVTTGGAGGNTSFIHNRDEFIAAVSDDEPRLVIVEDTIELTLYERVKVGSNKTIAGVSEGAMLRYGGLELIGNNIIVRNLIIGDSYDGDWSGKTNSTDCITIYGQHIWIDHCWLKTAADGLLDMRSGNSNIANYVTVSYCRFSDHNKVSLLGSSDSSIQDRDHLKVTFHHCWFDGTVDKGLHQRNPRIRYGDVHLFNNYYEGLGSYCIAARIESDVVVESNYFRFTPSPHQIADYGLGIEDPDLVAIDNIYELSWGDKATNGEAFVPSDFYEYTPDPTWDVPQIVMNEAGPFNPGNNISPTAVNDTVDFLTMSGGVTVFVTDNDIDPDSDDLRLAQIVNQPAGVGYIKENKIIYAPPANATGIDTVAYSVVDTEGGVDTGYVLIFMDGLPTLINEIGKADLVRTYPNPADDTIIVELLFENKNDIQVQLLDSNGRDVKDINELSQNQGDKIILHTRSLPSGSYFLNIKSENIIYSNKIIIAH